LRRAIENIQASSAWSSGIHCVHVADSTIARENIMPTGLCFGRENAVLALIDAGDALATTRGPTRCAEAAAHSKDSNSAFETFMENLEAFIATPIVTIK